jgi:hypothetical protein
MLINVRCGLLHNNIPNCLSRPNHKCDQPKYETLTELNYLSLYFYNWSISVAERSKARACGRSLAGVAVSNRASCTGICVVCCNEKQKTKCGTTMIQKQVGMKCMDVCLL